ncbi:TetR/AcrR family transcriptional regulator [Streptomyces diastatochromogenes]|uniref:TetR family transcriptional regulator n=1 Tax=Streptomyces diastatochromogenes TaxID=42236 RepID=A0A233STX2_STRDA|nr:TetR/AcrR family transcriptional regulator [Streptomyces diastatochromogenes]MCZ0985935.1 TetR/AcrR family transcriptional regulator [Streptomyces diastatochromogenes]OXY99088.1 TetR family transcriptional regulator [Streptomyces diastatochromogenes]
MRVTKAQAEQNRAHIVATAARLFRERGYDGVGVAELMAEAGFTHGGFYKHFHSKTDLMAEASANGLSRTASLTEALDVAEFVDSYVSREHRDGRGEGCTITALSGDAARQPDGIKTEFTVGIESLMTALQAGGDASPDTDQRTTRATLINVLAHSVGAIMLSRACSDDSPLTDEILDVCRGAILASLAHGDGGRSATEDPMS